MPPYYRCGSTAVLTVPNRHLWSTPNNGRHQISRSPPVLHEAEAFFCPLSSLIPVRRRPISLSSSWRSCPRGSSRAVASSCAAMANNCWVRSAGITLVDRGKMEKMTVLNWAGMIVIINQ